jgi:hypothetical protein
MADQLTFLPEEEQVPNDPEWDRQNEDPNYRAYSASPTPTATADPLLEKVNSGLREAWRDPPTLEQDIFDRVQKRMKKEGINPFQQEPGFEPEPPTNPKNLPPKSNKPLFSEDVHEIASYPGTGGQPRPAPSATPTAEPDWPGTPAEPDNYGPGWQLGRALAAVRKRIPQGVGWLANEVRQGILSDEDIAEIKRNPYSPSSIAAYANTAIMLSRGAGKGERLNWRMIPGEEWMKWKEVQSPMVGEGKPPTTTVPLWHELSPEGRDRFFNEGGFKDKLEAAMNWDHAAEQQNARPTDVVRPAVRQDPEGNYYEYQGSHRISSPVDTETGRTWVDKNHIIAIPVEGPTGSEGWKQRFADSIGLKDTKGIGEKIQLGEKIFEAMSPEQQQDIIGKTKNPLELTTENTGMTPKELQDMKAYMDSLKNKPPYEPQENFPNWDKSHGVKEAKLNDPDHVDTLREYATRNNLSAEQYHKLLDASLDNSKMEGTAYDKWKKGEITWDQYKNWDKQKGVENPPSSKDQLQSELDALKADFAAGPKEGENKWDFVRRMKEAQANLKKKVQDAQAQKPPADEGWWLPSDKKYLKPPEPPKDTRWQYPPDDWEMYGRPPDNEPPL